MPDLSVTNPQGTANTPAPGTDNNPQGTQQSQEPAWLSKLPEQDREEAKKSYLLQSDYTKKTQEIADRQKAWETEKANYEKRAKEWDEFQQSYQPFYQKLQSNWDKIAPILAGQQPVPATQQPQHTDTTNAQWENWDVLPPQEQAKRLAEHVNQQYVTTAVQKMQENFQQQLAQREQQYQNYLNILTDAYGRKFQDPNLDLNAYMKKVLDIQMGRENPMDLGYTAVTSEATKKAIEEAAFKRGREEAALEFQNKQQTNGALQTQTIPNFRQKPLTREQVAESVRQQAITKGLPW